jgi:hypothetical protein
MIRDSPSFADAVVDAVNTLPAGEQATACTMPGMNGTHLRPSVVDYCEGKLTGFSRL